MTVIDELLADNERYAAGFTGPLPLPPAKNLAVVACMDARAIQDETGIKPQWSPEAFDVATGRLRETS